MDGKRRKCSQTPPPPLQRAENTSHPGTPQVDALEQAYRYWEQSRFDIISTKVLPPFSTNSEKKVR